MLATKYQPLLTQLGTILSTARNNGGQVPFEALRELRTSIGQDAGWAGAGAITPSQSQPVQDLYNAVRQDLAGGCRRVSVRRRGQALATHDAYVTAMRDPTNLTRMPIQALGKLVTTAPDALVNSALTGGVTAGRTLQRLRWLDDRDANGVPNQDWQNFAAYAFRRMADPTGTAATPAQLSQFSPAFATKWNSLSDSTKAALFDGYLPPGTRGALDDFAQVTQSMQDASKSINWSQSGNAVNTQGAWNQLLRPLMGYAAGALAGGAGATLAHGSPLSCPGRRDRHCGDRAAGDLPDDAEPRFCALAGRCSEGSAGQSVPHAGRSDPVGGDAFRAGHAAAGEPVSRRDRLRQPLQPTRGNTLTMSGVTSPGRDYSTTPGDNNAPPPVGAPPGWYPSAVGDVVREMMSVIALLGEQVQTTFGGLGNMATQNAEAVAISGGSVHATLSGDASAVTNLNAYALASGVVPFNALQGFYNIGVTEAATADSLNGITLASLIPIGSIFPWFGDPSNPNALDTNHWAICDGTRGTPDLRGRFMKGAGSMGDLAPSGSSNAVTDAQGWHSHGGSSAPYQLGLNDIPSHIHVVGGGQFQLAGGGIPVVGVQIGGNARTPTETTGNSAAHAHGITGDGSHAHNVSVAPPAYGVWFIMRVA